MARGIGAVVLACVVLASVALALLGLGGSGRADMAPPPPPAGADILPGTEATQVRMEAETVTIEVANNVYGEPARATVKATFTMRNLGEQDEAMQARFPLNVLHGWYGSEIEECVYPLIAPEIEDFRAWADGSPLPVTVTTVRMKDDFRGQPDRDVKCWANFPVTFPAGETVMVDVQYSVQGYYAYDVPGMVEFPYVLLTGAGWKDTIGRAEVVLRAPFALDSLTMVGESDRYARVEGKEIRWVREDFEPDQNVTFSIVDPGLWQRVEREKAALAKNRSDGEAWGRLGRWYKEANRMRRGWRWDAGAAELYALSREAYTQAVTLKPKDADWHAGFADLLCWTVIFDHPLGDNSAARDDRVRCADEVRQALALNPNQALAKQLLEDLAMTGGWQPGDLPVVEIKDGRVVYTVLTTTPTVRPTEIIIPTATDTPEPSATPESTATAAPTATPEKVAQVEVTATSEPTPTMPVEPEATAEDESPADAPEDTGGRGLCGAGLLPGILAPAAAWALYNARRKWGAANGL